MKLFFGGNSLYITGKEKNQKKEKTIMVNMNNVDEVKIRIAEVKKLKSDIENKIGYKDAVPSYGSEDVEKLKAWIRFQEEHESEVEEINKLSKELRELNYAKDAIENGDTYIPDEEGRLEELIGFMNESIDEEISKSSPTEEDKEKARQLKKEHDEISRENKKLKESIGYFDSKGMPWRKRHDLEAQKKWVELLEKYGDKIKEINENREKESKIFEEMCKLNPTWRRWEDK